MLNLSTIRITDVTEGAGSNRWSVSWITALRRFIEINGMSASQAAEELNFKFRTVFTRNAVISQCKRAKIQMSPGNGGRTGPKGGPSQAKPRQKAQTPPQRPDIAERKAQGPRKPPTPYVAACDPMAPGTVSLVDLTGCKWPSGDGPFLFCDAEPFPGLVYCACHAAIAYRAPEPRRVPA